MSGKDKWVIASVTAIALFLFVFTFWLGFPGYFQEGDIYNSLALETNHWHPVIIARVLQFLYVSIGKHSYYLFLFNVLSFYGGIWLFCVGFYLRTKSSLCFLAFLPTLVGNIFFQNFVQYHSFTFPMFMWIGMALIFFIILNKQSKKVRYALIATFMVIFLFALMWRHNAIVSIFPLFLMFSYVFLSKFNINNKFLYIFCYVFVMFLSAVLLVGLSVLHPHFLSNNLSPSTSNHIFLHQISGAVVPAADSKYFHDTWYAKGKSFADVVALYNQYPLLADPLAVGWEPWVHHRPFRGGEMPGLQKKWIMAILKYPGNYLAHIERFIRAMWLQEPGWIFNSEMLQKEPSHPWHVRIASGFPQQERRIQLSPVRKQIYDALYNNKIILNHIDGVVIGFVLLITGTVLWFLKQEYRSPILMYCLSASLSSVCTAIVVCIFAPAPDPRYMSPVLVMSLISLIGFLTFLYLQFICGNTRGVHCAQR